MVARRVTEHEPCGNSAITCGQLWTGSGQRAEGLEKGAIYPQLGQRSVKAGMWCEQVVPSLCVMVNEEGWPRSGGVPMSYPQLGRTWGRAGLVGSVVQVGRGELDGPRLGLYAAREVGYLVEQAAPLRHELADLPVSVHDRCVIPTTECLADLRKRQIGELPAEVHGDLPCGDEYTGAACTAQVINGDPEIRRRRGHDLCSCDLGAGVGGEEILQDDLSDGKVNRLAIEGREGSDSNEGAFEFTDVTGDL